MGKYAGNIGYGINSETVPGVWSETIVEKRVYGEVFKNVRRLENGEGLNNDIVTSMQISFISNPYSQVNFHLIKYAWYLGTRWKIIDASVEYPRIILTLGGVYNAKQT